MRNEVVVSPYFLDQSLPELEHFAAPRWRLNCPAQTGDGQLARMTAVHESLARFVAGTIRGEARPVSIAGDCCAAIGVLAGLQRAGLDPVLLWLDAHGDFNTAETTPSGFLGGMPLAMIVGRGNQTLPRGCGLRPLAESDVVLADARDLDPGERELLASSEVRHVPDVSAVPDHLPASRPLYVHYDADVLDPAEAPAMLFPVPGGPSLRTLCSVMARIAASRLVAAISLTPWHFAKDHDRRSQRATLTALEALAGESLQGASP